MFNKFMLLAVLTVVPLVSGCAFSSYGRMPLPKHDKTLKSGLTLEEVVTKFGPPNRELKLGEKRKISYLYKGGWWVYTVFFGSNFGYVDEGDIELEFDSNERLISSEFYEGGSSLGIWMPAGHVGN